MPDLIMVDRSDSLARVRFNRPSKHNAFTIQMYQDFAKAMKQLGEDETVRCVILSGEGGKAFCVGSDVGEFSGDRMGSEAAQRYVEQTADVTTNLVNCPHPTIARINGYCVGGGLEIAAMCDIRICSDDAKFSIPSNKLGLTLDYAELSVLVDLIGRRRTAEILLDSRMFGAEEALRIGLVSKVVPLSELDREVDETAERIVRSAPLSNRWHKKFLRRLADPAPLTAEELEEPYLAFDTADYQEGSAAFAEKRLPNFQAK